MKIKSSPLVDVFGGVEMKIDSQLIASAKRAVELEFILAENNGKWDEYFITLSKAYRVGVPLPNDVRQTRLNLLDQMMDAKVPRNKILDLHVGLSQMDLDLEGTIEHVKEVGLEDLRVNLSTPNSDIALGIASNMKRLNILDVGGLKNYFLDMLKKKEFDDDANLKYVWRARQLNDLDLLPQNELSKIRSIAKKEMLKLQKIRDDKRTLLHIYNMWELGFFKTKNEERKLPALRDI